ncbi:ATP-binding protein [Shewanella scandinavica]|uniref:ATP-binding protein n=1 Tax=Shewanella scandinavica TaxID=3063538 RepID=UPI0031864467
MSEQSNQIYESIQIQIQTVIQSLSEQQCQGRLAEDISGAMENLSLLNERLQNELNKLKESSEWKRFTIAFYGETNAGKSSLIEALRLQLGEKTKQESQRKFKEIQQQFGLTQEKFDEVRDVIMDTEKTLEAVNQELATLSQKYAAQIIQAELAASQAENKSMQEAAELAMQHNKVIREFESETLKLNELLQKIRAERNWWQKITSYIFESPEKKQLAEIKYHVAKVKKQQQIEHNTLIAHHQTLKQLADIALTELQAQKKQEQTLIAKRKQELQEVQRKAETERNRLDNEANKLAEFADGQIIGDGRSDFTRTNTAFDFNLGGQQFSLIDVPGIEGDETVVSKPIEEAVRKAHAVFYVTRTARPPQTNDGNTSNAKGTLEKIKAHLGAQSEVWSIYNHPANSPRQLTSPLLNEDNRNSLAAMDAKLKTELKEQYCGSLVISARPAYLALTECIVPGSKDATEQRKFLEKFTNSQAILLLSGLTEFVTCLKTNIIDDYRNKILRSNLNKAYKALYNSLSEMEKLQAEFTNLEKNVKSEVSNSKSQINVCLEEFTGSLHAAGSKVRCKFHDQVQKRIYDEIEGDISHDEFKRSLKNTLNQNAENIQVTLKQLIENEADALGDKIKSIIKRSSHHLKNIVTAQNNNFDFQKSFKININMDNGLKLSGLVAGGISAALGVAFLVSNPVGWTVAFVGGVLALVGSVVGIVKSVWGFFDSDYKKSQQRKETDKVLREANKNIENEINTIITQIKQEMFVEMGKIQKELEAPVKQCIDINTSLKQANTELTAIASNIKS